MSPVVPPPKQESALPHKPQSVSAPRALFPNILKIHVRWAVSPLRWIPQRQDDSCLENKLPPTLGCLQAPMAGMECFPLEKDLVEGTCVWGVCLLVSNCRQCISEVDSAHPGLLKTNLSVVEVACAPWNRMSFFYLLDSLSSFNSTRRGAFVKLSN